MGVTIFRPGQPLVLPGVQVMQTRPAAAVSSWWLSGGISPANAVAAYQPKGAASLAASYINLANPGTYNAAPGVAPAFNTADGWTFNGTSGNLITGITMANGYSVVVRLSVSGTGEAGAGRAVEASSFFIIPNNATINVAFTAGGATLSSPPAIASGGAVLAIAGQTAYRDGVSAGAIASGTVSGTLIIGNRAADDRTFDGKIQAVAIYDTTLSGAQISALVTAMNAL